MSNLFFYWVATANPYQVGDRVIREDVDCQAVLAGDLGTVVGRFHDSVEIEWDNPRNTVHARQIYSWPARSAYFSKISSGQSKRPVLACERCGEYNEYAEANQPNGAHRCWQCKQDRFR